MQGKRKRLLVLGVVLIAVVGAAWAIYSIYSKPDKRTPAQKNIEAKPVTLPASFTDSTTIEQKYGEKDYAEVVSLARSYDADKEPKDFQKLQILSLCLDAAIKIRDNDGKEYCYGRAKILAQASPDEQTRTALTKRLNDVYNGVLSGEGSGNDGKSQ